jgi:hypothetical protein
MIPPTPRMTAVANAKTPETSRPKRASSLFDQRHLLVVGYVWNLPFAKNWTGVSGVCWHLGGRSKALLP